MLDEREQLRKQQMAIHDRLREIDAEIDQSTIARIKEGDCYFRFSDFEHSPRQNKNVYVHVLYLKPTPSGYALYGVQVWPDIPRLERGSIGWTLHACRSAWERPDTGEKITKDEFASQLEATVGRIRSAEPEST